MHLFTFFFPSFLSVFVPLLSFLLVYLPFSSNITFFLGYFLNGVSYKKDWKFSLGENSLKKSCVQVYELSGTSGPRILDNLAFFDGAM